MKIYKIDNLEYKQYFAILDIIDNSSIEQELLPLIKRTQLYKKLVYSYLVDREDEIQQRLELTLTQVAPKILDAIFQEDLFDKAHLIIDTSLEDNDIESVKQEILDLSPDLILIDDNAEQLNPVDILSKLS